MKTSSILTHSPLLVLFIIGIISVGFVWPAGAQETTGSAGAESTSVEIGIAELSPNGESGGFAIPASACGDGHPHDDACPETDLAARWPSPDPSGSSLVEGNVQLEATIENRGDPGSGWSGPFQLRFDVNVCNQSNTDASACDLSNNSHWADFWARADDLVADQSGINEGTSPSRSLSRVFQHGIYRARTVLQNETGSEDDSNDSGGFNDKRSGNNVSNWRKFQVHRAPSIDSFQAQTNLRGGGWSGYSNGDRDVLPDERVQFAWSTSNVESCWGNPNLRAASAVGQNNTNHPVYEPDSWSTEDYKLTCRGTNGELVSRTITLRQKGLLMQLKARKNNSGTWSNYNDIDRNMVPGDTIQFAWDTRAGGFPGSGNSAAKNCTFEYDDGGGWATLTNNKNQWHYDVPEPPEGATWSYRLSCEADQTNDASGPRPSLSRSKTIEITTQNVGAPIMGYSINNTSGPFVTDVENVALLEGQNVSLEWEVASLGDYEECRLKTRYGGSTIGDTDPADSPSTNDNYRWIESGTNYNWDGKDQDYPGWNSFWATYVGTAPGPIDDYTAAQNNTYHSPWEYGDTHRRLKYGQDDWIVEPLTPSITNPGSITNMSGNFDNPYDWTNYRVDCEHTSGNVYQDNIRLYRLANVLILRTTTGAELTATPGAPQSIALSAGETITEIEYDSTGASSCTLENFNGADEFGYTDTNITTPTTNTTYRYSCERAGITVVSEINVTPMDPTDFSATLNAPLDGSTHDAGDTIPLQATVHTHNQPYAGSVTHAFIIDNGPESEIVRPVTTNAHEVGIDQTVSPSTLVTLNPSGYNILPTTYTVKFVANYENNYTDEFIGPGFLPNETSVIDINVFKGPDLEAVRVSPSPSVDVTQQIQVVGEVYNNGDRPHPDTYDMTFRLHEGTTIGGSLVAEVTHSSGPSVTPGGSYINNALAEVVYFPTLESLGGTFADDYCVSMEITGESGGDPSNNQTGCEPVGVDAAPADPVSLEANPSVIRAGGTVDLEVDINGNDPDSCTLSGAGVDVTLETDLTSLTFTAGGEDTVSVTGPINSSRFFQLRCENEDATDAAVDWAEAQVAATVEEN